MNRIKQMLGLMVCLGVIGNIWGIVAAESGGGLTAKPTAPQSFQIRNKKFGDLLRPEDANSATGTRIVLYPAQSWKCMTWKLHPVGEMVFQAQNHFTAKTFEPAAKGDGAQTPVVQVPFSKEAKERPSWRFIKLADGLYHIIDMKSGKALTAVADGGSARVVVETAGQGEEQEWELIKTDPSKLTM